VTLLSAVAEIVWHGMAVRK